jgi:hypothetical protein
MGHKSANSARFVQIGVKKFMLARRSLIFCLNVLLRTLLKSLNSRETTYQPYFRESNWTLNYEPNAEVPLTENGLSAFEHGHRLE